MTVVRRQSGSGSGSGAERMECGADDDELTRRYTPTRGGAA